MIIKRKACDGYGCDMHQYGCHGCSERYSYTVVCDRCEREATTYEYDSEALCADCIQQSLHCIGIGTCECCGQDDVELYADRCCIDCYLDNLDTYDGDIVDET